MIRVLRISVDIALALAALAVLAVLGSGGTTLTLPGLRLGLNHLQKPLFILAVLLALRVAITDPDSGWEGRARRALARLGLSPSSGAAGVGTVLRASLFFAGLGLAAGITDALQTWIRHPDVAPGGADLLALTAVSILLHLLPAWLAGLILTALLLLGSRLMGVILSGYGLSRAAALTALLGGALLVGQVDPEWNRHAQQGGLAPLSLVSLLAAGAVLVVFLGLPALGVAIRRRPALALPGLLGGLLIVAALTLLPESRPGPAGVGGQRGGSLLLVTVGSLRADALAAYGGSPVTPLRLDGLAGSGTIVDEALTPCPVTLPAMASLHLGQGPEFHGLRSPREPYRGGGPTLAETLRAAGYRTAAFLGSDLLKARRSGLERGFEHYDDRLAALEGVPLLAPARLAFSLGLIDSEEWRRPARSRPGAKVVEAALRWIEGAGSEPWMVWVHLDELRAASLAMARESPAAARAAYARAVAEADRQVGRLLDGLAREEAERLVLVVLTSDHGEALGEDGLLFGSARSLGDAAIRVPLILAGPGVAEGRRIPGQASLAEVAPAVAALLGVGAPRAEEGEEVWEPTRLHELASAQTPPPAGRAGRPVCLVTAGGPTGRLQGLRWAGLKLVLEPGGAQTFVWVGENGETRLDRESPGWADRLERMEAELTTCRLVAEGPAEQAVEPD